MPHAESMLEVRGTRIRVLRGGGGPPLIFLHGASGHVGWLPFLDRLSQRFDVIAPEHPGFGASDDPPWLDRPGDLAYFYLDLIEALKLDRVHLMGTSLGGWIAAELAVRNTSRLASLTLVCAVGIAAEWRADGRHVPHERGGERAPFLLRSGSRAAARLKCSRRLIPRVLVRNRSTVVRLAYPHFVNPDLAKWLHRVDVPTLLIWGANDGLVPLRFGETYRRLIPECEAGGDPRSGPRAVRGEARGVLGRHHRLPAVAGSLRTVG